MKKSVLVKSMRINQKAEQGLDGTGRALDLCGRTKE
jgi:hypothetical protein